MNGTPTNEIEVTAVNAVRLWDEFLKEIAKNKKLSGKGSEKVSSVVFAGGKKESARKKTELAGRVAKNLGMGYGYMLSTDSAVNKRAVPVFWVGEEALTESKHFTMIIEKGQAVILGKGNKRCVFLSNEKNASGGAELNFNERFGLPNATLTSDVEADSDEDSASAENTLSLEIHETARFASSLWGAVVKQCDSENVNLSKEVKNGLSHKTNEKKEKAFACEIEAILTSGQSVIYSTNPEHNDRDMESYIGEVRAKISDGNYAMAVECGKVTFFSGEEKVVYLSERLRGEAESSADPDEAEG